MSPEKQWFVYTKKADFEGIGKRYGIDPVIARVLRNRDIVQDEDIRLFLNGGLSELYSEALLPDAEEASACLCDKIRQGKKIRIVGDYDIDGICGSYILYDGLRKAGAAVDYRIPERIRDGYGINMRIVEEAVQEGIDTLVTCDNGISACEELARARAAGITVILTDHHEIRTDEKGLEILPPANFVINAKRSDSAYPEPEICGAVTAWKFLHLVYRRLGIGEDSWLSYLEFAGMATIGDVMKLTGENRIIAREALRGMNTRIVNGGLKELTEAAGLAGKQISCYHIGFIIGPCINAGGRLETAESSMRLFLAESEEDQRQFAKELKDLNDARKNLTQKGVEQAVLLTEQLYQEDKILVVYLKDLHESMAGIVAGRLKEQFGKPSIVFTGSETETEDEQGNRVRILKGSGRSIENWNMYEGLCEAEDLLIRFGGHPMAAGMSIREDCLEQFRRRLNENCRLSGDDLIQKIWIDCPLPLSYLSRDLIHELDLLEPFGNGNPKPVFAERNIQAANLKVIGKNRNVLKMDLFSSDGCRLPGLMFGEADILKEKLMGRDRISMIYHPHINEYQGMEELQVQIEDFR